jgi:DedD protein
MALFKFRKGGDEPAATRRQPESIEAMRQRARHRLIGAGVLVLIGVVGFPLLFDTQPRPIAVDIPIEIPDRNKVKPLSVPAQPGAVTGSVSGPVTIASAPAEAKPESKVEAKAEVKPEPKPEPKVEKAEAKAEPKVVAKAEPKPEPKPEPKAAGDGAKAQALLEGKPVETVSSTPAASEGRFVVQVGAFADPSKARETRLKVEHAGLKTYTHVAETKEGKRIRVRVGPFGTRAEADKAAEKIKGLDLPAAILTL